MLSRSKIIARRLPQTEPHVETAESRWNWLYKIGGAAALFGVAIYLIQLIVFSVWGQPETALGWFTLFESSELGGLLAFEILLVVSSALAITTTLALYVALRGVDESLMAIALSVGLVEVVAFIEARPAFEMHYLGEGYAAATTNAQRGRSNQDKRTADLVARTSY
jgi:hypothetical protein